jgi:PST family polysaccharide transporter
MVLAIVRHPVKPLFGGPEASQLLHFGGGGALNGALGQLALHGDNLIVGRVLGTYALGLYARAFSLMIVPVGYAGNMLFSVLFPALSQLRADRERFVSAYLASVALMTLAIAPVMAGILVSAPHLVIGLYGRTWAPAAAPLQIFCVVGLLRVLALPAGAVALASGQVYAEMRRQAIYTVWLLLGSLVGSRWGVSGVASGVATAIVFKYLASSALSLRLSGARWRQYLAAQAPGVILAGLVFVVAMATRLAFEAMGAGELVTFLGIATACAIAMPIGVRLNSESLRALGLARHLASSGAGLPAPLRITLDWMMRARA